MKLICTQIATICLIVITQNLSAQVTGSASSTNPNPTPGFGSSLTPNSLNGFTTTDQNILGVFPKNKTTELTSPEYYYGSSQSSIYFNYTFTSSNSTTTSAIPTITIIYGSPATTITYTAGGALTILNGGGTYYFSINLATLFPVNTNFKISLALDVPNQKALTAQSFSTNAILVGSAAPLPVVFAGFEAKQINTGVALSWKVGVEQDVKGYEVQRSADGNNFTKIGYVAASAQPSYSFTVTKPLENDFYRIKSIDIDSKFLYSIIVSIKGEHTAIALKAFPMPVQEQLIIQHSSTSDNSKIEIVSLDGRLYQSIPLSSGSQQTRVNLSSAKPGMYFVLFYNGNGQKETIKLIKQ